MKKIFLILLVLAAIAAVFIIGFIRSLGPSDPASLVPANTFVFATAPDLLQTATRWPDTSLAKISAEPDVKEFLQKPFTYLGSSKNGKAAGEQLLDVKPRKIFLTLTKFSPEEVDILLGFQFLGTHKTATSSLEFIRKKISQDAVISSHTSTSYKGDTIDSIVYPHMTLHSAVHGRWGFISNNLPTLQETLDRAAGQNRTPSLAKAADYLKVMEHLPLTPDLQIFVNSKSTLDALLAVGATMKNVPDPSQVEPLQKLGSIGFSLKIQGKNIRDSLAILTPNPPKATPIQHIAMKFTHPDTLGYLETSTEWYGTLRAAWDFSGKFLKQPPLFPEVFHSAFGPELAAFFSWPAESLRPPAILALGIQNSTEATQYLHQLGFDPLLPNPKFSNTTFYQMEIREYPIFTPTIGFHDNLLLAGLTASDVEEALSRVNPSTTLENSPAFIPALARYRSENLLFSFVNSQAVFERAYSVLRPIIIFSAALTPDLTEIVDTSKLPSAKSISKHLDPMIFTQQFQGNVVLWDSTGPITLDQALLAFFFIKRGMSFPSSQ